MRPRKVIVALAGTLALASVAVSLAFVGTIFEKTRLPLLLWFRAIWFVTSSKSGISAKELQRELGCFYQAAWLMLHKMRSGSQSARSGC